MLQLTEGTPIIINKKKHQPIAAIYLKDTGINIKYKLCIDSSEQKSEYENMICSPELIRMHTKSIVPSDINGFGKFAILFEKFYHEKL